MKTLSEMQNEAWDAIKDMLLSGDFSLTEVEKIAKQSIQLAWEGGMKMTTAGEVADQARAERGGFIAGLEKAKEFVPEKYIEASFGANTLMWKQRMNALLQKTIDSINDEIASHRV